MTGPLDCDDRTEKGPPAGMRPAAPPGRAAAPGAGRTPSSRPAGGPRREPGPVG